MGIGIMLAFVGAIAAYLFSTRRPSAPEPSSPGELEPGSIRIPDPGTLDEVPELVLGPAANGSVTTWAPPAAARPYLSAFYHAEGLYGLPSGLLARMAEAESQFNPNARSPKGALGLLQFMPATAAELGIDPLDPFASIRATAEMMRRLYRKFGDWRSALAAYNWGEGHLSRALKGNGVMPDETVDYVARIAGDLGL